MFRNFVKNLKKNLKYTISPKGLVRLYCKLVCCDDENEPNPKTDDIGSHRDNNITIIEINRPEHRNAIDAATAAKLCEAFNKFEADQTSPVAVLYGVGDSFCAGFDIFDLATDDPEEVSVDILMRPEGSVGPTRRFISKPIVCAINGFCVASGMELALMCDQRIMEATAEFGFFNRRFGVPMIDGGTARLPAMIGYSRALDLILTGRHVTAYEALEMGIVNKVVPVGASLTAAMEYANNLAKFPQAALKHDRNSLHSAAFESIGFNQAIQNEIMYTSKEIIDQMQEGIKWFNKKFKSDTSGSWMKYDSSMADWDNKIVAAAAATVELAKQAAEAKIIEEKKKKDDEKK